MAVSGIKGTGIGQVTIPSAEDAYKAQKESIGDIASSYLEALTSGTGKRSGMFMGVPDFAPEPQTRFGQLFDFPGIAESAARGGRFLTGLPVAVGGTVAEILASPTEAGIQSEIERIESELSPFREQLRRTKAGVPDGEVPVPGLGTFTTADAKETRPENDPVTKKQTKSGVDGSAEFTGNIPDENLENITKMALQDYLDQARPGTQPKDYAEYIKEFADATGLDVSGKPDKSTALMALGLSLMQNKAGKGFDVGKMLGAVGEAGEAALPEYQKAKSEARALRAKAGEYALSRRKEDEAKAQQRNFMYVVPKQGKGATEKERLRDRLMRGRYIRVSASELNALDTNEGFNKNYEFLPGDALSKMGDLFKAPESQYSDKTSDVLLFAGADDAFKLNTYLPKPEFTNLSSRAVSASEIGRVEREITNGIEQLDNLDGKFQKLFDSFGTTPPTAWNQVTSILGGLTRSAGIGIPDEFNDLADRENDVQFQKRFTEYLATRYAPQILQEAGKTISDADRQRVQQIVGEIALLTDPAATAARLRDLHEFIVIAGRKNMETAMLNLADNGGSLDLPPLTPEEEELYNQLVAKYKPTRSSAKKDEDSDDE